MNWKSLGAAIITVFILTLNVQTTAAQSKAKSNTDKPSATAASATTTPTATGASATAKTADTVAPSAATTKTRAATAGPTATAAQSKAKSNTDKPSATAASATTTPTATAASATAKTADTVAPSAATTKTPAATAGPTLGLAKATAARPASATTTPTATAAVTTAPIDTAPTDATGLADTTESAKTAGVKDAKARAAKTRSKERATIVVRVLDPSGTPLKQQAFIQLLSGGAAQPIATAVTTEQDYAKFPAAEAHAYTVTASAAGYETTELRLQTYRHDNYYQAILRLDPSPVPRADPAHPLTPAATEAAEKGLTAFESGDYHEAAKRFSTALQLAPRNPDLDFLLGVSLFESHHLNEAQEYLQRAASLDPNHVPSLTALGRVRIQQGEFSGAAVALKKAISISPTAWAPHLLLGSVDLARREFMAAVEQSREAMRLGQAAANGSGLLMGEALAAQGQREEARQVLMSFVKAAPESPAVPAARKLLRNLQENDPPANAELLETALISARSVPIANTATNGIPWHSWHPVGVDDEVLPIATGMTCPTQAVLDGVTQRVDEFVGNVNRFDATERIVNQDLTSSGKVISTEKRKFDYQVDMRTLKSGDLEVDETRNGTDSYKDFPDHIATLGLPSLALVFHQHYRDGYVFQCEGLGEWNGQATWLMHFRQRADRLPRIRGYNIDGELYPIGMTGRAWISAESYQIVHMEADLISAVPKIKLRYEHQAINYGPVDFTTGHTQLWLPKNASLYFDFEHHRFHRVHSYNDYQLFSVTTSQTISPPKQLTAERTAAKRK